MRYRTLNISGADRFDGQQDVPCWYHRGIPPKCYTRRVVIGPAIFNNISDLSSIGHAINIYLDGSGGKYSSDPGNIVDCQSKIPVHFGVFSK